MKDFNRYNRLCKVIIELILSIELNQQQIVYLLYKITSKRRNMTTHSIKTVWEENNTFSTDIDGHNVVIDLGDDQGGQNKGPRPKRLLLAAAAGCTGLDVVETLRKMRVEPKSFDIKIDAQLTDEHPKKYESMKLIYEFKGENLSEKKIKRAVELSFENYCGVLAMYKSCVPITYEVKINEE